MSTRVEKIKQDLAKRNSQRETSHLEDWVEKHLKECKIYDYIREYQVDYYFIDFAFPSIMLALEVDGKMHLIPEQIEKDKKKDVYLKEKGWEILRINSTSCWHSNILGEFLLKIFKKLYPKQPISWGLAELTNEDISFPRKQTEIEWCNVCKEFHENNN